MSSPSNPETGIIFLCSTFISLKSPTSNSKKIALGRSPTATWSVVDTYVKTFDLYIPKTQIQLPASILWRGTAVVLQASYFSSSTFVRLPFLDSLSFQSLDTLDFFQCSGKHLLGISDASGSAGCSLGY